MNERTEEEIESIKKMKSAISEACKEGDIPNTRRDRRKAEGILNKNKR